MSMHAENSWMLPREIAKYFLRSLGVDLPARDFRQIQDRGIKGTAEIEDQLKRALNSAVLNTA